MTNQPKQSPRNTNLGLLEYKIDELQKSQVATDAKVDLALDILNKMRFATPGDLATVQKNLDNYIKEAETIYIKRASIKGFQALAWAVATAVATVFTIGLLKVLGLKV